MNPLATAAGLMLSVGPFVLVLALWVHEGLAREPWQPLGVAAGFGAAALSLAGLVMARRPHAGRLLATLGVAAVLTVTARLWLTRPAAALPILLVAFGLLSHLWVFPGLAKTTNRLSHVETLRAAPVRRSRAAAWSALTVWGLYLVGGVERAPFWPVLLSFALCGFVTYRLLRPAKAEGRWRVRLFGGVLAVAALGTLAWNQGLATLTLGAAIPVAAGLLVPVKAASGLGRADWWDPIMEQPARMLVSTFLALCVVGTFILALPGASATDLSIGLSDAAFTAVSAVCVTGLAVLDTSRDFSFAGQLAILVLMQLGGLGIMTFSTAALRLLGRRLSLRHEAAMAELMSAQDKGRLFGSIRRLILFTFVAEAVGAFLLTALFSSHGDALGTAAWRGVFTAISAFCNAGFALQTDSLIPYQSDPAVLYTVGALIVAGGLSPGLALHLPDYLRGRRTSAQAQIVYVTSAILLVGGALWYGAVEWDNSLLGLGFWDKVHNAVFQSLTLRTAGFNSVDLAQVRPATLSMMMVWMFIGGSPGGTAGGIKTTTVGVLVLAVLATVRGRDWVLALGKHIPHRTVFRAAAVATVAGLGVLGGLVLLQLTQNIASDRAAFEVVSALGTVGLSIGATGMLDGIGRAVIMLCMFTGRVGTLTLFMILGTVALSDPWRRPSEDIEVG
ncbi:MAG: hypothetical protein KA712_11655 [Myxococcales bacterium]|nr:hypothetical protein [Myxococcales bacterium]